MDKEQEYKEVLDMFETQFTRSEDKLSNVKKNYKADNDFSLGIQWEPGVKASRSVKDAERPCIVVNKIDPMVHRIVNSAKQQKLSVEVKPQGDADTDTAEIFGGMLRNFEYVSNAVRAYMWAFECAVRGGIGYFQIRNEYENNDSFDQTVKFKRIRDPNCVSFDPDAEDNNGGDAEFSIISEEISAFSAKKLCDNLDYDHESLVINKDIWTIGDGVARHGEINWKEYTSDTLYELIDGSFIKESEIAAEALALLKQTNHVKKSRKIRIPIWWYANIIEGKVIEKIQLNTSLNPIIRIIGREGYIDGKLDYRGITRNSMDSNRMYNVMSSLLIERVGLAPRAPYIAAAGQIEGFEAKWLNANNANFPVLEYNPVSANGNLAPPPMKNDAPAGDPSIERYLNISSMDIKDTSNIADAFMGKTSNEVSGAGIKARSAQSDTAIFDLLDNCSDGIEQGNRVALDMAQRSMSNRQVVRIMGEDYTEKVITLNAFKMPNGETKSIDLSKGKFTTKITVSSGDKTKRETAIEQLSFVLQTNPDAAKLIMDVFVGNLDIKDAKKIANRFKATLPPEIIAAEENTEKDNPELDAYEQHATQIVQDLQKKLQAAIAELTDTQEKLKQKNGELANKNRETDIKQQEADTAHLKVVLDANANDKESKSEDKKKSKEESANPEHSDTVQLQLITRNLAKTEQELEQMHKELDMITVVLEKLTGQKTATQDNSQPESVSTQGNGLPPVEADNVGAI